MSYLQYCLGAIIVFVLCFQQSIALRCYECNSATDKRCIGDINNKLSEDLKVTCLERTPDGKPYKLCRKIKQVIDFEVNGLQPDSRIIRTCGWDDSSYMNRCYQRSGFGGRQEVCACAGDNCNSSTSLFASVTVLVSLLFVKLAL